MLYRCTTSVDSIHEGWKQISGTLLVSRQRVRAQPHASNDTECAFAADKQRSEIWSVGACRLGASLNNCAICEDHFESNDHVFNFPVARRILASSSACNPSTNCRDVERLWKVSNSYAVFVAQFIFKIWAEHAGQNFDHSRYLVETDDARKQACVKHYATINRNCCTAHTTAASRDGEGDSVFVAQRDDGYNLFGGCRSADYVWFARSFALHCPVHCKRPPVATMVCKILVLGRCCTDLCELFNQAR